MPLPSKYLLSFIGSKIGALSELKVKMCLGPVQSHLMLLHEDFIHLLIKMLVMIIICIISGNLCLFRRLTFFV